MKKLAPHFGQELRAAGLSDKVSFSLEGDLYYSDASPENPFEQVSRLTEEEEATLLALVEAHDPDNAPVVISEKETLSDWRVGLIINGRYAAVEAQVLAARDSGSVMGQIAWQRFEYANHVLRAELHQLKEVFGFTAEDVDLSMQWAAKVASGDLT